MKPKILILLFILLLLSCVRDKSPISPQYIRVKVAEIPKTVKLTFDGNIWKAENDTVVVEAHIQKYDMYFPTTPLIEKAMVVLLFEDVSGRTDIVMYMDIFPPLRPALHCFNNYVHNGKFKIIQWENLEPGTWLKVYYVEYVYSRIQNPG